MAYTAYVTPQEYTALGYTAIPTDEISRYLREASRNVDTLTFNRIVPVGVDGLTEFQQDIVKEAVCRQADFLYKNRDALNSIFDSYAINGVSMHFGTGFNVRMESGLPIQSVVYSILQQSGLCCRLAR